MAYDFLQAEDRGFTAANAISSFNPPLTLFARDRYPNTTAARSVLALYTDGSTNNYYLIHNLGNSTLRATTADTTTAFSARNLPGTNTWFAATGVFSATNNRVAYVDATAGTASTANKPTVTFNSIGIGQFPGTNSFTGQLADIAVWDAALTDDEINSLAQGFKPFRVRPQSLVYYVPLVRDVNELCDSLALTTSANAPTVIAHPRVY